MSKKDINLQTIFSRSGLESTLIAKKLCDFSATICASPDFVDFYGKNIVNESTLIKGVKEFLTWSKENNISMAVCTNKTDYLAVDLLKKIGIYDFFEYVAGHNTFDYCKPDPRHLTSVIEILNGDLKKSLMIGDSETDANAAKEAGIPVILMEDGYTEKNTTEIYHNHLVKDFVGIEKIVSQYL